MPDQPRPDNPARAIRVPDDLWQAAHTRAAEKGTTVSAVVRDALRKFTREGR